MKRFIAMLLAAVLAAGLLCAQAEEIIGCDTVKHGCAGIPITWTIKDGSDAAFEVYAEGVETPVYTQDDTNSLVYTPEKPGVYTAKAVLADGTEMTSEPVKVNEYLVFGTYEQDGKLGEREELEWKLLAVEDGKAFVVTKDIIHNDSYFNPWWIKYKYTYWACSYIGDFAVNYRGSQPEAPERRVTGITAENVPLNEGKRGKEEDLYRSELHARYWCNDMFYWYAFTDEEREQILLTHNENHDNPEFNVKGGPDTDDYVFLLSYEEVMKYMPENKDRMCSQTAYAKKENKKNDISYWWLRTPGKYRVNAMYATGKKGGLSTYGSDVGHDNLGYRPAMWITIGG